MTSKEKYINRIRKYLKDLVAKNQLLDGFESEDEDIEEAIDSVYDHLVISPPIKMDISLNDATKYLWFRWGVIAFLLDSEAILNTRNTLPYNDGGTHVDENAKAGPYSQMAINYWQKFDLGLRDAKLRYNLQTFPWGGTAWAEDVFNHGTGGNWQRPQI